MIHDLLWYRDGLITDLPSGPLVYRAPSWSWASVNGVIDTPIVPYSEEYRRNRFNLGGWVHSITLVDVHTKTHSLDIHRTGQVFDALLTVKGILRKLPLTAALEQFEEFEEVGAHQSPSIVFSVEQTVPFKWIINIGGEEFGQIFPDTALCDLEHIDFLPILERLPRKDSPTRDGFQASGIVLIRKSDFYERVGMFWISTAIRDVSSEEKSRSFVSLWLEDRREEEIIIR